MFKKKEYFIIPLLVTFWIGVLSFVLDAGLIISLISMIAGYIGAMILVTKEKPKISVKDVRTDEFTFEEYMDYSSKVVSHLQEKSKLIEENELSYKILNISENIKKINEALKKSPDKFTKNRKIFSYYIPTTVNIIDRYDEIEDQNLTGEKVIEYKKKAKEIINMLDVAYGNMLNNIYEHDMLDTTADMEVLNSIIKMEGLQSEKR